MKRLFLLSFLLLAFVGAYAQNISVKSFQALPMDLTASSKEGKRIDQNGQVAALIKVVTTETGFTFEGGTLGVVDTKQRNGEVWVWVPRGLRKITVLHQRLGVLRDYVFPVEIEAERTYEMVLTTAKVKTVVENEIHEQFLVFQITPPDAILEVDDQIWKVGSDGIAMKFVNFGTYNYRVRASDYHTEAGKVTVNDPKNTQIVKVSLVPNFAKVTLTVDADAEIWVNNEKKGIRTWTGPLGNGTYRIECRQEGYEPSVTIQEIVADKGERTITLPAPTPIYGSLIVESTPLMAKIFIDGKEVGSTPKSIPEILIGRHELRVSKEGYADYTETITIVRGERKQVAATLDNHSQSFNLTSAVNKGGTVTKSGDFYFYDGRKIDDAQYAKLMESCPQAWAEYQKGCRKRKTGRILLYVGGGLVGASVVTGIVGGIIYDDWAVLLGAVAGSAVYGSIPALISIPYFNKGKKLKNNAYNTYNQHCSSKTSASLSFGPVGNGVGVSLNF